MNAVAVVLGNDKALHPDAFLQNSAHQKRQTVRSVRQPRCIVAAHQATHRHARGGIQQRQHGVKHFPADVFIVDINAFRAGAFQLLSEIRRVVIETHVKPKNLNSVAAFFCPTGYPDHAAAFDFTDLPDCRPNRARRGGDHQRFTRFRLSDIQQPHIGGKARHPKNAQRPGGMGGIIAQLDQAAAVRKRVLLPAAVAQHPFTRFKVGVV